METLISIIIPIYNAAKNLNRCLESVRIQTYKNIEAILVNDGSSDASEEICLKYSAMDARFHYIRQDNSGVAEARNHGILQSSGDFIAFLDADDYLDETFCEVMLNTQLKEKSDVCICMNYNVYIKNINGKMTEEIVAPKFKNIPAVRTIDSLEYDFYDSCSHWTVWGGLYKRNLICSIKFNKELYVGEDTYFLSQVIKSSDKITFINKILMYYVFLPESASHGAFNTKKLTEIRSWERIVKLYEDRPKQQRSIKAALAQRCIGMLKKYYLTDKEFTENYSIQVIAQYRKNAKYILQRDIIDRRLVTLLRHLFLLIMPHVALWVNYKSK